MTLSQALEYVASHDLELLGILGEYREAVYRHALAQRLPSGSREEARVAANAQARAGLAVGAVTSRLYTLLTAGIDGVIDAEETEAREARGEALGTQH